MNANCHRIYRVATDPIFINLATKRRHFLMFFGLGGLLVMYIPVWHTNQCIGTDPGPIGESNKNTTFFFSLYKPLVFICADFFSHRHLFYIFMFLGLGGSRLMYVAVWHVSGCICICPRPVGTSNKKSKNLTASSLLMYTYKKLAHFPSRFFS